MSRPKKPNSHEFGYEVLKSTLNVHQQSLELAGRIFDLSKRWPPEERYSLTDQSSRAARSVGANIAESRGKRRYAAHLVSKLTDADSENREVGHWRLSAHRDRYLSDMQFSELMETKREVGKMLGSMIRNPTPFLSR